MERQMVSYEAYDSMENPYQNYEAIKEPDCNCGCEKCQQTQESTQFIKVAYDNPQIKVSPTYIQGEINREQPQSETITAEQIKVTPMPNNQLQTVPEIVKATPTIQKEETKEEKSLLPLAIAIGTITLCVYLSNKPQTTAKNELNGLSKSEMKEAKKASQYNFK